VAAEERLLSVAEIARRLSVPESTVHYWKNRFAQHLPSAGAGRQKRFREEAVDVFRVIAEMFSTGHSAQDVMEALGKSFPLTASHEQQHEGRAPGLAGHGGHAEAPALGELAETAVRMAAAIAKEMGAEIARSIGEGLRVHLGAGAGTGDGQEPLALPGLDAEELSAIKSAMEHTCGRLDDHAGEMDRVSAENAELKAKLSVLEAELIRLRKDRRELEKYLLDKIKSVST
jgi:DNA-binding transcriptional MerR regulator